MTLDHRRNRPRNLRRSAGSAALTLAACFVLSLAAGCRPPADSPGATEGTGGTAVVAGAVDMKSVNELTTRNTTLHTALHYHLLFQPLLQERADYRDGPSTFAPRLATGYAFSEDRLRLTFTLRDDLAWSDGAPITSEDVRWTWQAQTHPAIAWEAAEDKEAITDVEVVDATTVVFHFEHAYANQLIDAVQGVILPKHAWSALPFEQWLESSDWFYENLVSSGPFLLDRWERQSRIVLTRNPRFYRDGFPKLERLVITVTPDEDSRMALLRSGQANVFAPSPEAVGPLEDDPAISLVEYPSRQNVAVTWNVARPLFEDARVRRAMAMAIDRQEIIDTLYRGYARITASPLLLDSWVYPENLEPLPHDLDAARALLAEAGWRDDDGDGVLEREGQPFRFDLLTNSENATRMNILVMIQNHLQRVGVQANPVGIEFNTLLARGYDHDFEALVMGLGIDTSFDLTGTHHSSSIDDALNWGRFADPEADRMIDEIKAFVDPFAAVGLFAELQSHLQQEQPNTYLYQPLRILAIRGMNNVAPNALSIYANAQEWERVAD